MNKGVLDHHLEMTPDIAGGKARIAGSRITVQNIAIWHETMDQSADEICAEHNLTLAGVYAALAYYFDHREEIDGAIKADEELVAELRTRKPSLLQRKLNP